MMNLMESAFSPLPSVKPLKASSAMRFLNMMNPIHKPKHPEHCSMINFSELISLWLLTDCKNTSLFTNLATQFRVRPIHCMNPWIVDRFERDALSASIFNKETNPSEFTRDCVNK